MRWLVVLVAGCTLFSKSKPLEIRYFSPETPASTQATSDTARVHLRLGRITPAALLRNKIVHRESQVEVQEYDALRWTEQPDAYVRRALAHALFEGSHFDQIVSGAAPTLDVEIIAFEQVPSGGRVQLRYQLTDDRQVLARGDVICERPASSAGIDGAVAAIGAAMNAATAEVATRIATTLHAG